MIEEGRVNERPHPDDGRKRVLGFTEKQWVEFTGTANDWIDLTLDGIEHDTEVLKRYDLVPASEQETVAEFVLQIRRDGTLSVSGSDLLSPGPAKGS